MIASRRTFGKPGSPYDFGALNVGRLKERARELEETQKGMKKKVNTKVINMIDRCAHVLVRTGLVIDVLSVWRRRRLR
jgi:hypothetical protein